MPGPKIRRRARERACQFLFGLDFTRYDWRDAIAGFWTAAPSRPGVKRYAEYLVRGVMEHLPELDAAVANALENWAPERIGYIERNVIRVALFEMIHAPDVPDAVAINEAIEVARQFGSEDAPRFVNGVLDRLKGSTASQEPAP
ncbi:MAG: transcription antitermination factor NusB [Candidatus Hydrogenedentes bacterium]|nr:transcription antitermination factor NusB [Candidatus Hydrogenedentota bacterium]